MKILLNKKDLNNTWDLGDIATIMLIHTIILFKYKYKYVFRAVGCFPGPYLAKRFTEVHIN